MHQGYFKELENILKANLGSRGLENAFLEGELKKAARSLMEGDTIFIVTGFMVKDAGIGETDGPIGAVSMAAALEELGKRVVLISDKYSGDILTQCSLARGVNAAMEIIGSHIGRQLSQRLLKEYKPSHIIAVERPGRAADGICYSMRGEDLSGLVPIMDDLFEEAKKAGVITIGIGDGGNEIGMGKIRPYIVNSVDKGELICAAFASDFLIAAGVSNWGGHALAAALSLLSHKMLLHDINTEIAMLKSAVDAGAVDGCTKKRSLTVDGLSLEDNLNAFMSIKNITAEALKEQYMRMEL
ncbi:DUF4392 domain-containing protein [Lutispora sp.]|nr:DUF4392 domain-containing protein [Lutispora sp.]MEA4962928.1 DUF4392 domain-containing protein [Lutispora sp.]